MMANDMDIDMDIDIGLTDDPPYQEMDSTSEIGILVEPKPILSNPSDTANSHSHEPVPEKIHLRGLDNLTSKDIKAFASEYFQSCEPVHIEWIDDTSANLVYESAEFASQALECFAVRQIPNTSQMSHLPTFQAKPIPEHREMSVQVRIAVTGDRKQAGARERSRFYLFHPEYDPAERSKRAAQYPRRYRDRDDGSYRNHRYDKHEQRRRERDVDFDVSLYDDDEVSIARRKAKSYQESAMGMDPDHRKPRRSGSGFTVDKELFPDQVIRDDRMLRERSASPSWHHDGDQTGSILQDEQSRQHSKAALANRQKAQKIKAQLQESKLRELFPDTASNNHRRSNVSDVASETADLFASRMAVPFLDGTSDSRIRGASLASRITIAGAAKASPPSFNIKGAATGVRAKELFPSSFGNAGKELFSERLEGRKGQRRQKAEDLFS